MVSLQPYNISLNSTSPTFTYQPFRDGFSGSYGDPAGGWRSSFSNVTNYPGPGVYNVGSGVPFRETYLDGANVTLEFEGTAVYLCVNSLASSSFEFAVDGQSIASIGSASDPACAQTGATQMAYASGLAYGNHSATIRVSATGPKPDFLFYGGVVTVGVSGANATAMRLDDTDPGWIYSPNTNAWVAPAGSDAGGNYNDTFHWTCSYGSSYTASYTFNGSSAVQLIGMCDLNIGPFTVQLDDRMYGYNGSDLWRQTQQVLFFAGNLDPTQAHTITLMNFQANVPDPQQPIGSDYYTCATVDGLILTQTTPGSTFGNPSTGSISVGAIVGGVAGGMAALAVLGFLLWFFFWRRKQHNLKAPNLEIEPFSPAMVEPTPYGFSNQPNPLIPTTPRAANVGQTSRPPISELHPGQSAGAPSSGQATASSTIIIPRAARLAVKTGRSRPSSPHNPSPPTRPSVPTSKQSPRSASEPYSTELPRAGRRYLEPSTAELVDVLNQRLRAEYRGEDGLDPPNYEIGLN